MSKTATTVYPRPFQFEPRIVGILIVVAAMVAIAANGFAQEQSETPQTSSATGSKIVIDLTNQFRAEQKLPPVKPNQKLSATALQFAQYMARTEEYGHEADGRKPGERAKANEYRYCIILENIGWRYRSEGIDYDLAARWLTQAWKDSPEHRDNMLDGDVTETGVAIAKSEETGRYYGVQLFGRPDTAKITCKIINRTSDDFTYKVITASGSKSYSLKPRFNRTHALCRAAKIGLPGVRDPRKITSGEQFVATEKEGKLTITITREE